MAEILATLNPKGFEAPEIWAALRVMREKQSLVSLVGEGYHPPASKVKKCSAWMVVGGDGTLNHVVNELMRLEPDERCPICYIPYGTGNDFARTLGLSELSPAEILERAFSPEASYAPITVVACGPRFFLNMASGGLFATVTPEANPAFKSLAGRWAYFVNGLGKLLERETALVSVNGAPARPALGFFVANARFAGGGVQVVAGASPFEPNMDFLLVPDMPAKDLLALGLELQKEKPELAGFPVGMETGKELRLSFDRALPINLDGEQVQVREARFAVYPDAIKIFLPA